MLVNKQEKRRFPIRTKRECDGTKSLASGSCPRYKTSMNTYENPSAALESLQARIVALRDSL